MNVFGLLFETGEAIRAIFMLGYLPEDKEFHELTYPQYQYYFETYGYTSEKVFMLIPEDGEKYRELAVDAVLCMTESEKNCLKDGALIIEKYCKDSGKQFDSFEEKLYYVASCLPPLFSKNSRYARKK